MSQRWLPQIKPRNHLKITELPERRNVWQFFVMTVDGMRQGGEERVFATSVMTLLIAV